MPRINATVGEPLGPHDPEHSPLCRAFQAPGVRSVAVVGNGPLNDAQRKEIDTFDVVVRSGTCSLSALGSKSHDMLLVMLHLCANVHEAAHQHVCTAVVKSLCALNPSF